MRSFLEFALDLYRTLVGPHTPRGPDKEAFSENKDLFLDSLGSLNLSLHDFDQYGDQEGIRRRATKSLDKMRTYWLHTFNSVQPLIGYSIHESRYLDNWHRWTELSFNVYSLYCTTARQSKNPDYYPAGWSEIGMVADFTESTAIPLLKEFDALFYGPELIQQPVPRETP